MAPNKLALWWVKRDMRLSDNPALTKALQECTQVLPVFIWEPSLMQAPDTSAFHLASWAQALHYLRQLVQGTGAELAHITDEVPPAFDRLRTVYPFTHIYSHQETGNALTYARDRAVARWCHDHGITWCEVPQNGVIRRLQSRDGRSQIWQQRIVHSPVLPAPTAIPLAKATKTIMAKTRPPKVSPIVSPVAAYPVQDVTEYHAQHTLQDFLQRRGVGYRGGISSPLKAFTRASRLSVHLAWGTLSLRQAYQATLVRLQHLKANPQSGPWAQSLRGFLARLHWRDHFIQRLESDPTMEFTALNPAYQHLPYTDHPSHLHAWAEGQTGYPLVDACMRCLAGCGWLNFRMRAMVVSFACFSLHLDWRFIHPHLARVFQDYEPGIHLSQLQMQAGVVGINTIRVYNPSKQLLDQDPHCKFVKTWVPELRPFTTAEIANADKVPLGAYPRPIVDHKAQTKLMKEAVFAIRRKSSTKALSQKVYAKHGSRKKKRPRKPPPPDKQLRLIH